MKQILYFDWHSSASEWYRLLPLDYLLNQSFTITRSNERNINFASINNYDIVFISRAASEAHLNIIKLAKDLGKKIILDYDDDCLNVPETNPAFHLYNPAKPITIKCLKLADEIWVATDGIKKGFSSYNSNIHVIPNAWNDTVFPVEKKKPFKYNKLAMWRGGHSHIADIYAPGTSEWLIRLINSNPKWKWYLLGQRFEWLEMRVMHSNYYRNDGASPVQFYKMMQSFNPCLFYYPLQTTLFNQSKSNCSFLESVYSGAAYFGNTLLPEFKLPGVSDLSELEDLLKCSDSIIRKTLRKSHNESWNYIQQELLLSKVNKLRLERLLSITG